MTYIPFPSFQLRKDTKTRLRLIDKKRNEIKTAGILGGLGQQSTSLFYNAFTEYCLERDVEHYPRLIINSVNCTPVIQYLEHEDMKGLYFFLKKEIEMIQMNVDFIVMVCNSIHAILEPLRQQFDIPIISIFEEVCREVALSSVKKVGILGTKTTILKRFYQKELERLKIDYVIPAPYQVERLDTFIFQEALKGRGGVEMKRLILEGIKDLVDQGCDGVILACTELPLFITQEETEVPLFMSTQLLAQVVVDRCFR